MRNTLRTSFVFCCALGALVACGEDDPVAQGLDTGSPDAGDTGTSDTSSDVGGTPTECEQACAEIGACDVDDACGDVLATCLAVCADDGTVRFDERAIRPLFDEIGDFTLGYLLGAAWVEHAIGQFLPPR
jgi:hypothetical protein